MATIVTRIGKGSALTYAEADANWTGLNDEVAAKQAALVSGTNIKTINGSTILGAGDLVISGGGGGATNLSYDAATRTVASDTGTDAILTVADGTNAGLMTAAGFTKLAGVALGATANSPDATLLARANHTGTQAAATISDFATAVAATAAVTANTAKVTNARHTGDATGSTALTLATVNANVGSFGSATAVATFTANGKGLTTAAGSVAIAIPASQVTDFAEAAQDAVGGAVGASLIYDDATPRFERAALTGAITAAQNSNTTALGSFTKAQLDGAVSDGNVAYVGDAPTAHTHPLADLTQSGATTNQVPQWNGSAWVPATVAGGGGAAQTFFARLPVDFTLLTQTASQRLLDTSANGALALDVGVYRFEAAVFLTGLSATTGNGNFNVLGAGTATTGNYLMQSVGIDNNAPLSTLARGGSGSNTSSVKMATNGTGTGVFAVISGHFEVTVAGTIIPSIDLGDLPTAPVAKAGTTFRCTRMADTVVDTVGTWT